MRVNLLWIGTILLVFGTTMATLSYFNLYYWEDSHGALELPIGPKSTGDCLLLLTRTADMKKLEVRISNGRLDVLNKTLGYGYLWNFTLTLSDSLVFVSYSKNVSVTINPDHFPATYIFDIPDDWQMLAKVSISNPEAFPVFVLVETTLHRYLLNSNWQMAMNSGIVSTAVGVVLVGLGVRKHIQFHQQEN